MAHYQQNHAFSLTLGQDEEEINHAIDNANVIFDDNDDPAAFDRIDVPQKTLRLLITPDRETYGENLMDDENGNELRLVESRDVSLEGVQLLPQQLRAFLKQQRTLSSISIKRIELKIFYYSFGRDNQEASQIQETLLNVIQEHSELFQSFILNAVAEDQEQQLLLARSLFTALAPNLKKLRLENTHVIPYMGDISFPNLEKFVLHVTSFEEEGRIAQVCDMLGRSKSTLKVLDLGSRQATSDGLSSLVDGLCGNLLKKEKGDQSKAVLEYFDLSLDFGFDGITAADSLPKLTELVTQSYSPRRTILGLYLKGLDYEDTDNAIHMNEFAKAVELYPPRFIDLYGGMVVDNGGINHHGGITPHFAKLLLNAIAARHQKDNKETCGSGLVEGGTCRLSLGGNGLLQNEGGLFNKLVEIIPKLDTVKTLCLEDTRHNHILDGPVSLSQTKRLLCDALYQNMSITSVELSALRARISCRHDESLGNVVRRNTGIALAQKMLLLVSAQRNAMMNPPRKTKLSLPLAIWANVIAYLGKYVRTNVRGGATPVYLILSNIDFSPSLTKGHARQQQEQSGDESMTASSAGATDVSSSLLREPALKRLRSE